MTARNQSIRRRLGAAKPDPWCPSMWSEGMLAKISCPRWQQWCRTDLLFRLLNFLSPWLKKKSLPRRPSWSRRDEPDASSEEHEASAFLRIGKKRSGPKFLIRQKNCSFWDTSVSKISVFFGTKRSKVFNTSLFLETEVFLEYFKNTELPNGVLFVTILFFVHMILVFTCDLHVLTSASIGSLSSKKKKHRTAELCTNCKTWEMATFVVLAYFPRSFF